MEPKGHYLSSQQFTTPLLNIFIDKLNSNPYHILKNHNSQIKERFLSYEALFVNAINSGNISDYWHYIETLLSFGEDKKTQDKISTIILLNEKLTIKRRILNTLSNSLIIFNGGPTLLEIDIETYRRVHKNLRKGYLIKEIRRCKYPFIKQLVDEFDTPITTINFQESKKYYQNILLESYELRNQYIHNGIADKKSIIKLKNSLTYIIQRFRWIIYEEMIKGNDVPFDILIDELFEKGNKLLK